MFEETRAEPSAPRPSARRYGRATDSKSAPGAAAEVGPAAEGLAERLRARGLRPTRQRIDLLGVLQAEGDRHVSAEVVYDEALRAGVSVSLATVYNTLKQFTEAGLLTELAVSGAKSFFDTRVDRHHHFYVEGEAAMIDLDLDAVGIERLPEPPEGMEVVGFDVVVRLRRKA